MSIDRFASDPSFIKAVTNPESDGVGRDNGPQNIGTGNPAPYYEVSVKEKPGAASDTTITHTGPGVGTMGGVGSSTDLQGFVSPTGNRVVIDNTFGADTITLQHHSGATIVIDADGSIHMISSGRKGVGIVAPKGDATLFAKGHMILKGDGKITIETEGDLEFNVGGTLSMHVGGDMITTVRGSVDESIDGSKSFEIAKDMSTMIAGDNRITSAGKMRIQSSKSLDIDAADDISVRTDNNINIAAQKNILTLATGSIGLETKSTYTVKSTGNMSLQSKGTLKTSSTGETKISSQAAASVHAAGAADFLSGAKIQIKGTTTDVQIGGTSSPDSPTTASDAPAAQYPIANTVIDNITSLRVAPDFPINAARMSAEEFALYKNEGGNPNPQAEAYAAGNKGAGVAYGTQDSGITAEAVATGIYDRPAGDVTNNGKAEQNPLPVPSSIYNSNEKISRYVTVGQIINLRNAPASQHKAILQEAMNVAWNILDPLIEKFGSRLYISSWYRDNSSNHIKGGAVDVRCINKPDYGFTAEVAAYVRDNLPFSKILLEKNDQGGIHCHLESARPGQQGGGTVLTCADPHCQSAQAGIKLSYAVAALEGKQVG